jgi:hypothetical protein
MAQPRLIEFYPDVDDVAAIIRARTQDDDDQEIGTFNEDTRPTGEEVERLIAQAGSVVFGAVGDPGDWTCATADDLVEQAEFWVSMLAAMLVELSYFPEQVRSDRSGFQYYKDLWDDELAGFGVFRSAAIACGGSGVAPDGGGGSGGGPPANASWAFPVDAGGMVGWQTRW